ncbi:protein disulfide-isomerase A1 [Nematocida sp. AWRm80]|nr:protein disulfide-isomerase A1 [Nematocida sp. AWRm80]
MNILILLLCICSIYCKIGTKVDQAVDIDGRVGGIKDDKLVIEGGKEVITSTEMKDNQEDSGYESAQEYKEKTETKAEEKTVPAEEQPINFSKDTLELNCIDELDISKLENELKLKVTHNKNDKNTMVFMINNNKYTWEISQNKDLNTQIQNNYHKANIPLFDEITQENYTDYEKTGLTTMYLISNKENKPEFEWVSEVMEGFKYDFNCALLDYNTTKYFLNDSGVHEHMLPCILAIVKESETEESSRILKYLYRGNLSTKQIQKQVEDQKDISEENKPQALSKAMETMKTNLTAFFEGFKHRTLQPFLMSEEIPEAPESKEGVTTVVKNSFDSIALDPLKDTLMVYHIEWCNFCKIFLPELDKLGQTLKQHGVENITIGKMLMSKNDLPINPGLKPIVAYPTIRLYKKGTNEEIEYLISKSPASAVSVLEFLKQHTDLSDSIQVDTKKPEETKPTPEEVKLDL